MKEDPKSEQHYQEAGEKYAKAIELNPDNPDADYHQGIALHQLTGIKRLSQEDFDHQAYQTFKKAIKQGSSSYKYSCLYACKKDKPKAFELLETSLSQRKIKTQEVEQDPAWETYDQDPDFVELINRYR